MKGEHKSASTKELVGLESGTAIHDYHNLKSPWFKEQGVPSKELVTDHIIPCAEYDLTNPDEQRACFHYTNLQFLTPVDNSKKSDRVPIGFNFKSTLKKQLDLIARIEKDKLTYQQVLEMQRTGKLYEVKGYEFFAK
jgi:hypothetical protein